MQIYNNCDIVFKKLYIPQRGGEGRERGRWIRFCEILKPPLLSLYLFFSIAAPRCAPEFTEPLTDVTSQVGDDQVVLQCRLCGMPLPRVTWYHNATLVRNRAESNQSFDSGVAQLTLSPVSHDLAGDYQCVARNMSGESRTVCQLTVEGMLELAGVII